MWLLHVYVYNVASQEKLFQVSFVRINMQIKFVNSFILIILEKII